MQMVQRPQGRDGSGDSDRGGKYLASETWRMVAGSQCIVKKMIRICSYCPNEKGGFERGWGSAEGSRVWRGVIGLLRLWKFVEKLGALAAMREPIGKAAAELPHST
jgi:hypothetical protein